MTPAQEPPSPGMAKEGRVRVSPDIPPGPLDEAFTIPGEAIDDVGDHEPPSAGDVQGTSSPATRYLRLAARGSLARALWLVAGALLAVPSTALLVRSLGVRDFGTLSLGLTVIALASALADLGTGSGVSRMAAYSRDTGVAWARAGARVAVAGGLLVGVGAALAGVAVGGSLGPIILLLSPTVVLAALISVMAGYLRTCQKVLVSELVTTGQQTAYSATAIGLAAAGVATIWRVAGAALACEVVAAGIAWLAWRNIVGRGHEDRPPSARLLRFSLPLLLATASTIALQSSDVLLLGAFRGPRAVGLYYPVLRMVNLSALVLSAVGQYFLPAAASILAADDREGLRSFYVTVMKWETVVLGPPLVMLLAFPRPLIEALFGAPFGAAAWVTRVLALGYLVNVLTGHNWMTMVALGMTKQIGIRSTVAFVANIAVNLALIPAFGMLGAALGTSLVYVGLNATNGWFVWKAARIVPVRRDVLVVLSALAVGTGVPVAVLVGTGADHGLLAPIVVFLSALGCALGAAVMTSSADERAVFRSLIRSREQSAR